MPTAFAIAPRASPSSASRAILSMMESRDFTALVTSSSVGLLLTIGLALPFPLSNHWIALLATTF